MFRVMLVDDREIARRELRKMDVWGDRTGFMISEEAGNGQEAMKKLERDPVDLVITDIRMPVMDGVELLKRIEDKQLCQCVIFLSEYSEFEYARQGLVHGAFDYLVKPVEAGILGELLKRAATHITEIAWGKERLRKLEEKLKEKIEPFYPMDEVKKMTRLFKEGDFKVVKAAESLFETSWVAIGYDPLTMAYVLNKVLANLVREVQRSYPWLHLLVNLLEYEDVDFNRYSGVNSMKPAFVGVVEGLMGKICRFEFGSSVPSLIRQVCKLVLDHVDTEITIKEIAESLFLNNSYLSTLFKEKTGFSLGEYITMVKMERAKMLLANPDTKNYEIANKLGYKDSEYFSRIFKKHAGCSPSDFRQYSK